MQKGSYTHDKRRGTARTGKTARYADTFALHGKYFGENGGGNNRYRRNYGGESAYEKQQNPYYRSRDERRFKRES